VTALDLLVVYMPLLGAERHIDAGLIGMLLMIRTIVSILSRLFFSVLIRTFGRTALMVACLVMSGVAFALLVLPVPIWVLALSMAMIGFGLGIAAALSLSSIVDLSPPEAQGTAVSLRITGNRIGQVGLPVLAGAFAAALGAGGVMGVIGLAVGATGLAVFASRRNK
jgi:MFS family permease